MFELQFCSVMVVISTRLKLHGEDYYFTVDLKKNQSHKYYEVKTKKPDDVPGLQGQISCDKFKNTVQFAINRKQANVAIQMKSAFISKCLFDILYNLSLKTNIMIFLLLFSRISFLF